MIWQTGTVAVEWMDGDKREYQVSGPKRGDCVRVADGVLHLTTYRNEYEPGENVAVIPIANVRTWQAKFR